MKYFTLITLVLFSPLSFAASDEDLTNMKTTMNIGKKTGICTVLKEVFVFQKRRKIENGDKFASEFVRDISKKLKIEFKELVTYCNESMESYNEIMEVIDKRLAE